MKRLRAALWISIALLMVPVYVLAAGNGVDGDKKDVLSLFRDMNLQSAVNGSVVTLFGNLNVDKPVNGDVTTIFGDITVRTGVKGRVTAIFGDVTVEKGGEISGSVVSIGTVRTSGVIRGDAITVLGDMIVDGSVSGDLFDVLGDTALTGFASVGGDLVAIGSLSQSSAASISGRETYINIGFMSFFSVATIAMMIVFAVFVLFLGLPLLLALKDRTSVLWECIGHRTGKRLLIGFCGFLAVTLASLLLFFTVLVPVVYFLLLVLAETAAAIYVGFRLLNIRQNAFLSFGAGFLAITVLKVVFILLVPSFGILAGGLLYLLFDILVSSAGIGILADTRFGTRIT